MNSVGRNGWGQNGWGLAPFISPLTPLICGSIALAISLGFGAHAESLAITGSGDAFEPDDRATIAQPFGFPPTDSLPQLHDFHVDGDEDWYAFPDTRPCQYFYDWTLATANFDGRFQPIVEIYPYDILVDPNTAPTRVLGGCFGEGPPLPSLNFNEKVDGIWRVYNCPDVIVPPGGLPYRFDAVLDIEVCGPVASVSGTVRNADDLTPFVGGMFVRSDQNVFTVAHPATGRYATVVNAAAPGGPPVLVTLEIISETFQADPVTVSVTFEQSVTDADLLVSPRSVLFADGFEDN